MPVSPTSGCLSWTQLLATAYLTISPDFFYSTLPVAATVTDFAIAPIEFDKDIDAQMRVVAAVSNLRARNYAIPEADLHVSRGIAGKITPAIATTTAMVTGMRVLLVQMFLSCCLEPFM